MQKPQIITAFQQLFAAIPSPHTADGRLPVATVYAQNVVFLDPLHHIEGIDALQKYFDRLQEPLKSAHFVFLQEEYTEKSAALEWIMHLEMAKGPLKGQKMSIPGVSLLQFTEIVGPNGTEQRVLRQRDYFDVGDMLYERIPVLGGLLKWIKKQV